MNDPDKGLAQEPHRLGIQEIWRNGITGDGVRIGHLDTGVDADHPALSGRILDYAQFGYGGIMVGDSVPEDASGHGTHTAAVICGGEYQGKAIGVAPDAKLICARALEGGSVILRMLRGMEWMLSRDIHVLIVAAGLPYATAIFFPIIREFRRRGILVVCPAGNAGAGICHAPGCYPNVLSVGALDSAAPAKFSFSSLPSGNPRELKPDVLAPGTNIVSASADGGLVSRSGTSMAAALVCGVLALLRQANPAAGAHVLEEAIKATCQPVSKQYHHRVQAGIIDPWAAFHRLDAQTASKIKTPVAREDGSAAFFDYQNYVRINERLETRCRLQDDDCVCEAVIVTDESLNKGEHGVMPYAASLIAHISKQLEDSPRRVDYIPQAHATMVRATTRLIRKILENPGVLAAHSVDVDLEVIRNLQSGIATDHVPGEMLIIA